MLDIRLWTDSSGFLPRLQKLTESLLSIGAHHLGMKDPERVFRELILDSVAPVALGLIRSGRIIDIGCGVGLPSIPLVAILPELRAVLIDERTARIETARAWAEREGVLDRIEIIKGKIERHIPNVSRETDVLVSKGLGGVEKIYGLVEPKQNRFHSLLLYAGDGPDFEAVESHRYQVGGKTRRILVVSHSSMMSTF